MEPPKPLPRGPGQEPDAVGAALLTGNSTTAADAAARADDPEAQGGPLLWMAVFCVLLVVCYIAGTLVLSGIKDDL